MSGRRLTSKDNNKPPRLPRRRKSASFPPQPDRKRLVDSDGPDPHIPPEYVIFTVGVVSGTHGREGTLKVRIFSDDPEHLLTAESFSLGDDPRPRTVVASQLHAGQLLVSLDGITTPEDARRFLNLAVRLPAAQLRPLAPGDYFLYQLLGLSVVTKNGEHIGTVTDFIETGANDVLVVSPMEDGVDTLLPMIPDVVLEIDPAGGTILAKLPKFYGEE